jgi:hypothetical protein
MVHLALGNASKIRRYVQPELVSSGNWALPGRACVLAVMMRDKNDIIG